MLNIIKFKGCRRCGGDLFLERDADGSYVSCLQCGAVYGRNIREEREGSSKATVRLRSGR